MNKIHKDKFGIYMILSIVVIGFITGIYFIIFGNKNLKNTSLPGIMPSIVPTIQYSNSPTPDPMTADWKTYTNITYGFEFKYPEKLKLIEDQNSITLNHSILYKNNGDCDMVGGNKVYETLDDFNVSFELSPKIVTLENSDGEYRVGKLVGQKVIIGAEGCGNIEYNFPLGKNKTLVVKKAQIQALSGLSLAWNKDEILKIPRVISSEESKKLFDQILSTFKFLE